MSPDAGHEHEGEHAPSRWQRLSALFDAALEMPTDTRAQWVIDATEDDPSVRDELVRMLAAVEDPVGVLDRRLDPPVFDETPLEERLASALAERYTITRSLGRGGMASVFLARERKHDRDVVIKVLDPAVAQAYGAQRFHDEVRIAACLSHPHILALIDSGDAGGLLYYVMPRIDGESLRERLHRMGRLPLAEVLPMLRDLADALGHAHSQGVIHRDLKPDNILCAGGHAYLLDFGVAKRVATRGGAVQATHSGDAVGTPGYMSPEQAYGQPVDARSDLYAWGLVATEFLSGRAERGAVPDVDVPVALASLINRCLSINPQDRPASANELVSALDGLIDGGTVRVAPRAGGSRRMPAAAGALTLVGALAAGWWATRDAPAPATNVRLPAPVAVAPLLNETGDSTMTVWGRLASDWLTQGLEETNNVAVIPWTSVRAVTDAAAASSVGDLVDVLRREAGAVTVVSGSYYAMGDSIRVQLAITDARTHRSIGAPLPAIVAPRDSMTALMRMLRERLQGFVALQLDERVPEPSAFARVPPTYESYRAFDRGIALYNAQEYRGAATELRESYARDTSFLAPLIFAAMAHWNTGELEWTDTLVHMLQERRARLSPFADAMTTHLDALLASDGERAFDAIRVAATVAPGMRAEYSAAHQALAMNRPDLALDLLQNVDPDLGMMRGWQSYWTQLSHAHHLRGEHDAELAAATEMRRRYPANRAAGVHAVRALAAGNRMAEADALLDSLAALPAETYWSYGGALVVVGDELLERGELDGARRYHERAITWFRNRLALDPNNRVALYWLGSALYQVGEDVAASEVFERLAREYPNRLQYRGLRAVSLARLGLADSALAALGPPPSYARAEHTSYLARIAAVRGDTARASALLEETLRQGYAGWPWYASTAIRDFADLRDTPAISRVLPLPAR